MDRKSILAAKILDIIQGAVSKNPNVRIIFSEREAWKSFEIHDQQIVHIDSTDVTEKFGALLLMSKLITTEALKTSAHSDRKSWEIDEEILEKNNIHPDKARRVFSLQLSRSIHSLLDWSSINFKVSARESSLSPRLKKPIPLCELLLHLLRFAPSEPHAEKIKAQKDSFFRIKPDLLPTLTGLPLNAKEGFILSRIKGHLSPNQIAQSGEMVPEKLFEILGIFDLLGFLEPDAVRPAPTRPTPAPAAPTPEPARAVEVTPAPQPLPPEEDPQALIKLFNSFREELLEKNFYEMLDLSPSDFSISKLKTNYYALAKKYHPDKYRKFGNDQLNDTLERILNMLNNAYETLKEPNRRVGYDEEIHTSQLRSAPGPNAANQAKVNMDHVAKENFEQGKTLIQAQKYAEAIAFLKRSVQIKGENAEYRAYLGYAMSKVPQFRKEAEQHFLKSIEINPMNVNTYLHLGRLYKEAKMYNKASGIFQEALRWDPENKVTQQELDEVNEAMGRKSKGGLFGGLFKR